MDDADLLAALLNSLATEPHVYCHWQQGREVNLGQHVHELALTAEADWSRGVPEAGRGPLTKQGSATVEEIEAALSPVERETAIELLVRLSADDLVFPGELHRDRAHAKRAAVKLASILGPNAEWFSNLDGPWENGRGWDPVTRYTFDGVVVGRGSGFVVALMQVGED